MKKTILLTSSLLLLTFALGAHAEMYTLAAPKVAWRVNNASNAAQNVWAAANTGFAGKGFVEGAFPFERNKPQYYLGDTLVAPDNVDWSATYELFKESAIADNFLFDLNGQRVYVTRGATSDFRWVIQDGATKKVTATNRVTVIASPASSGRPKNIFWTDVQYGGRTVDLSGKFVKLFGPESILTVEKSRVPTGETLDNQTNYIEVVTSGLYIDESSDAKTLYAAGTVAGTVVLAYYDSGSYDHIVDVITLEVSRPQTIVCSDCHVGDELHPTGRGYGIAGLTASPTTTDDPDGLGPYLYQHSCEHAYAPQNGCVFAIRPSTELTRNQTQIYWFETDNQGVSWPYEVNEYLVSWASDMPVMVRGDAAGDPGRGMTIPSDYTPALMDYQESDDAATPHATAPADGVFTTTGAGRALLKLVQDDSVWFVPVRSVLRNDTDWFRHVYVRRSVGQELTYSSRPLARGLTGSALASRAVSVDTSIPAYVYRGASDPVWNENLYSDTGTGDTGCSSVVYPVTAPMDAAQTNTVELWWSATYAQSGMPSALTYPTLPQNYRIVWPDDDETPDITLASQLGGAGISRWARNGAATFRTGASRLRLKSRSYFPNGNGTVAFWTRAQDDDTPINGLTNAPSCLLQLGTVENNALFVRIGKDEQLEVLVNDTTVLSAPMPQKENADDWTHVALTVSGAKDFRIFFDGVEAGSGSLAAPAEFLTLPLDQSALGLTIGAFSNVLQRVVGESQDQGEGPGAAADEFVDCETWEEVRANLTAGKNVRLRANITQARDTIYFSNAQKAVLDLNGFTWTGQDGYWVFGTASFGAQLTIIDSSEGQTGMILGKKISANSGGAMFRVRSGGTLAICGGTFKGSTADGRNGGCVYVDAGGTLVMNGGTIKDCSSTMNGGAVYVGGTFTMNGGSITNCTANADGGGVYVATSGTMTLNGGQIGGCMTEVYCGGGIYNYGTFTMNSGSIVGCTAKASAYGAGGGILAYGTTTINGGLIARNTAPNAQCPCIDAYGGTLVMNGGFVDVAPTKANYVISGRTSSVTFTEPLYFGPSARGFYIIGLGTATDRQVAEVKMWSRAFSAEEIATRMYATPAEGEDGLLAYYSFRNDEDGEPFKERVSGLSCSSIFTSLAMPGVPGEGDCVLTADAMPTVYRQNDATGVGYNPNEEHAFVRAGGDGYVAWAFRCDLNAIDNVSKPGVLVEYVQDGLAKMQYFDVKVTNECYTALAGSCTAGFALPGPHPFLFFDDPYLPQDYWEADALPPYRDRKGQIWARCAGAFDIYLYYRQQATYDWPTGAKARKTTLGEAVPWLAYLNGSADDPDPKPAPWRWTVDWPTNGIPHMKIGQTLTTAADDLPEVWNASSIAVIYPTENVDKTAKLYDPTAKRTVETTIPFTELASIGLSTEPGGKLQLYKGAYYFRDMPPSVSDRCCLDVSNTDNVRLILVGRKDDDTVGELHMNVLESVEQAALNDLSTDSRWRNAVAALATPYRAPTETKRAYNPTTQSSELQSTYQARDHYALTAMGLTNWVVLIENDAPEPICDAGNPISVHVFQIIPEYDLSRVVARQDELNLVSQIQSMTYAEHFAAQAGDFEFQWGKALPNPDGTVPEIGEEQVVKRGDGLTTFTIGGQGDTLANMVNTYWTCRYRATTNSPAHAIMGDKWSDWCKPYALAEGWVQRVLNNITPFTQRATDLYENGVDSSVSMLAQAGEPYTGDVALNMDNCDEVGLIQLYRTILSKAESMSLLLKVNDPAANKQLLLAVERLADLYGVLGDEAYTDALNPTIGFGSTLVNLDGAGLDLPYGAVSSALFCFDNQVPTLLDEELALLRGRSCVNLPDNTTGPYYNRLVWNYTKGITAGEVAYAVNYNISGVSANGTIDEEMARKQFPQGHGDAYGHYLSALQGYYRLMRNPYFSWDGIVGMGEMNVADNAVNVDYYDEATFAKFAAKAAKTAARTVELTALKAWRDNGADAVGGGYADANVTNAFGYGEWAVRGGYGALCNWAVANDLLPEEQTTNDLGVAYADAGLLRIDRGTAEGIVETASSVATIQRVTDRMDAGMNPLGLNDKAIPFDLTPIGGAGDATHYEQIRERAGTALANAAAVLDKAQTQACRQRNITDAATTFYADRLELAEQQYRNQLVEIYGKPYEDDIGVGGTYPQGYDGPDYYHYMWMDLESFGLTNPPASTVMEYTASSYDQIIDGSILKDIFGWSETNAFENVEVKLKYRLSSDGVIAKPDNIMSERRRTGSIQVAYADFLSAYASMLRYIQQFDRSIERMKMESGLLTNLSTIRSNTLAVVEKYYEEGAGKAYSKMKELRAEKISLATFKSVIAGYTHTLEAMDSKGLGFRTKLALAATASALEITCAGLEGAIADCEKVLTEAEMAVALAEIEYESVADTAYVAERVLAAADEQVAILADISSSFTAMETAQQKVLSLLAEGENLRDELELVRRQTAKNISKMRYYDMFFRQTTSEALSQYEASFALARTYALLAAKAYGYETGSSLESTEEGQEVLRQIVGARMIGELTENGGVMVSESGDVGLSGILAKLDDNWANQKSQLGINNPQTYATWFSLRHELFRILTDETGDSAWQTELAKYWKEDIRSEAEFKRYCQPFASQFGFADKEPGLVIPFETTIDFAYNLFGKPLAFDDHQFDSTYYATKIASAGVWFEGYNEKREGYRGASAFAVTPNVYLVPVGTDKMRVPGSDANDQIASFDVIDQTIPVPYPLTAAEIADANWLPSYLDGEMGGVDAETRLRRHPSFRAYFGNRGVTPNDANLDATRLTGRSVWNTRWLLVIPAGAMGSDRDQALKSFIYGLDTDRDGIIDVLPVSDIKIGFKTYSIGGK